MRFHHGNVGSNDHDTISSENNEDSLSDGQSDDEMSIWIQAVTRVK